MMKQENEWNMDISSYTKIQANMEPFVWQQTQQVSTRHEMMCTRNKHNVFFHKQQIPIEQQWDVMYGRIVCDYRKDKTEPNCTQLTMGGDRINYPDDCSTPTMDLLTVKHLLNSVILTPKARFMTMDIKSFYQSTPLTWYKYLCLKLDNIPKDVSRNMSSMRRPHQMGGCMLKCTKAHMDCHKQEY